MRRAGSVAVVVLVAVAFVARDRARRGAPRQPAPGGTQTIVRTLRPLPLAPAARETVTVTTSRTAKRGLGTAALDTFPA